MSTDVDNFVHACKPLDDKQKKAQCNFMEQLYENGRVEPPFRGTGTTTHVVGSLWHVHAEKMYRPESVLKRHRQLSFTS